MARAAIAQDPPDPAIVASLTTGGFLFSRDGSPLKVFIVGIFSKAILTIHGRYVDNYLAASAGLVAN